MKISEFVNKLKTTKETVRHYEDIKLLTPLRHNNRREYGEKEILQFEVIMELKAMGMSLKDIQLLFELKEALGCGDHALLRDVTLILSQHLNSLQQEEEILRQRRLRLQEQLEQINRVLI